MISERDCRRYLLRELSKLVDTCLNHLPIVDGATPNKWEAHQNEIVCCEIKRKTKTCLKSSFASFVTSSNSSRENPEMFVVYRIEKW